jgi:hypothetical protein
MVADTNQHTVWYYTLPENVHNANVKAHIMLSTSIWFLLIEIFALVQQHLQHNILCLLNYKKFPLTSEEVIFDIPISLWVRKNDRGLLTNCKTNT